MNLPLLKDVLTDPDEFLSNAQLKALALEILELIPMDGIEGSGLDPEEIMEVVLRAAVGTTSINGVTTKTSDTPNRETVMDWLHTLEKPAMLDAVNDILALVAMTVLDPPRSRTVCIDFMDNPFHGHPEDDDEFRRMKARDGTTKCHRYCTAFVIARGKPLTLAIEPVAGEDSKADAGERGVVCVSFEHLDRVGITTISSQRSQAVFKKFLGRSYRGSNVSLITRARPRQDLSLRD